ncbi:MAG: hypothetical protein QXH27_05800 [Candidatus Micrarchaeia archaeon]
MAGAVFGKGTPPRELDAFEIAAAGEQGKRRLEALSAKVQRVLLSMTTSVSGRRSKNASHAGA